ncbi:MAG: hypothetical protein PHX70_12350 [Clostridium sp.]|nr:hypothetical protein [Clostridium sp.]
MEYNFLPLKYVFRRKRKLNIIYSFIFVILIVINIIFIYRTVNIYCDVENIKSNINFINENKNKKEKVKYTHSDLGAYNTFKTFTGYMSTANTNYYVNVDTKNNINAIINVNDMDNYEKYISYIEKNTKYKIKKLQALQNGSFEVTLEANNK